MKDVSPVQVWQQRAIGVCLITFLIAVYFFTFSGYAISRDEWFLFDATESMARRGTLVQNYELDAYPPLSLKTSWPPSADAEPMQSLLAAPLFLIAQVLPGIGLVHTVWLFNVLITALTAGTLYAYGLALGYRVPVAALTALMFGLGTIVWPYSRTFFREPLFTWLALLSVYLIVCARKKLAAGERPFFTLIMLAAVFAGMLLSKEVALLLLPVIVVVMLPSRLGSLHITRRGFILAIIELIVLASIVITIFLIFSQSDTLAWRYNLEHRLQQTQKNSQDMFTGISGYLFSPGRSLWFFSPVLLLGLFGWRRLARQHRWREIIIPLIMLVSFIVGYALVRGAEQWSGGLGWGARYLIPVIPFIALWLLPVIEAFFEKNMAWWQRGGVGIVFLISAGIQIAAILVPIQAYYDTLTTAELESQVDLWSVRRSQIPGVIALLGDQEIDLAWQYAAGTAWLLPVLCLLLAIVALGWTYSWLRPQRYPRRRFVITTGSLTIITVLVLGSGLYAIRQDPRYAGNFQPTHDLLYSLASQVKPDDVIVLNDYAYSDFFMNYYKLTQPIVYTLPQSPGERFSPEQPPEIEAAHPDMLIHFSDTLIFADLARRYERLWLVMNSSRFVPWSVRPVEHYLSRHYFPVSEVNPSDLARAVLFDMTPAPSATRATWPAQRLAAVYGSSLQLMGYDIPGGTIRHPGDVLPISLLWKALAPVPQDYTVGIFLMSADGTLAAQRDSFPVNYFESTQSWRPGSLHRDNHGLQLPASLVPGTYELWVVLYYWATPNTRLPVTDAEGNVMGDHMLLTMVRIE